MRYRALLQRSRSILLLIVLALLYAAPALAAAPYISGLSPDHIAAGSSTLITVDIMGSNFVSGQSVQWNGTDVPATFINSTDLRIAVDPSNFTSPHAIPVTANNANGASNTVYFNIQDVITAVSPSTIYSGQLTNLSLTGIFGTNTSLYSNNGSPGSGCVFPINYSSMRQLGSTTYNNANSIVLNGIYVDHVSPGGANCSYSFQVLDSTSTQSFGSNWATITVAPYPAPVISSVSPTSYTITPGNYSATTPVTLTGSYLDVGGLIYVTLDGTNVGSLSSTLGATSLTYTFSTGTYNPTSSPWSIPGSHSLTITDVQGTSNSVPFTIYAPVPTLTSIAGGDHCYMPCGNYSLALYGTNFLSSWSKVYWDGTTDITPSSGIGPGSLSLTIPSSLLTTPGAHTLTVVNLGPGGGTSNSLTFTVHDPQPTLTSLSVTSCTAPCASQTITLTGTNFYGYDAYLSKTISQVRLDGSTTNVTTTYGSGTSLTATISSAALTTGGTHTITVYNNVGSGYTSAGQTFAINDPVPTLTSATVTSCTAPCSTQTVTLTGTNFVPNSQIQWDGSPTGVTTTYTSTTSLRAGVDASLLTVGGTHTLTVFNPTPGGGTSAGVTFTINNPPAPALTSISPASCTAPCATQTVTVTGSSIVTASQVYWDGSPTTVTTTYGSGTSLTASIPSSLLATGGTHTLTVFNPAPGGGTSAGVTFTINNPVPGLTSLDVLSCTAPCASQPVTLTGTGFMPTSQVQWGGSVTGVTTTYVSSTSLTASVDASLLTISAIGTHMVTVSTAAPGGGTSNGKIFTVNSPVPTLGSITPVSCTAPCGTKTINVIGSNFVSGGTSQVQWDGSATGVTTTYVSGTSLTASIDASLLTVGGTHTLTVVNAGSYTSTSNLTFTVNNPVPTLTSVDVTSCTAPCATQTVTVTGTNIVSSSQVQWDGSATGVTTTYVSGTALTASIDASLLTVGGTHTVRVFNATPGGGTSSTGQTFTINDPVPGLTSLDVSSCIAPCITQPITLTGANFVANSQIQWDGSTTGITTTYNSGTSLTASIDASLLTVGGTHTVTVVNPTPGGGLSSSQTFTVNDPVPSLTSISVSSCTAPCATQSIVLRGDSLMPNSQVQWDGSATGVTTTYMDGTALTASIDASLLTVGGTHTVTVVNPTPGGGTSVNALPFTINYRTPTISSITPTSAPAGASPVTITVTGTGFYNPASTTLWNGTALPTTVLSATQATAIVPATNLATADTVQITVTTPSPGGGTSNAKPFVIVPTLQVGALQQDGWNVSVPVTWPAAGAITNQSVTCGASTSQPFTGATGTCTYSTAGTYQIVGTSTIGGTDNVTSPHQTVVIPSTTPTTASLAVTVDGRNAASAVDTYTFPVPLAASIVLGPPLDPTTPGIVDALNLNLSTITLQRNTDQAVKMTLTGSDPLSYAATHMLTEPGTYTVTLNGTTNSGAVMIASATVTVTLSQVSLQGGPLQQDTFAVLAPVTWPDGASGISINCGTSAQPLITTPSGLCRYTAAGSYSVTGRYTEPYHQATVTTPPLTITVPLLVPDTAALSLTVNNLSVTGSTATRFTFPASLATGITVTRPDGVGIVDQLDTTSSYLSVTPAGGTAAKKWLSMVDPLHFTATAQADTPNTYTVTLNGTTTSGASLTATATLTLTSSAPSITLGTLTQNGAAVTLPVAWPQDLVGATPVSINCGTSAAQLITTPSGVCTFTAAGTYNISGAFTNPETNSVLHTALQPVTVPAVSPTGAAFSYTINTVPVTGDSVSTYELPTTVHAHLALTLPSMVGIAQPLDLGASRLAVTAPDGSTTSLKLTTGADPLHNEVAIPVSSPGPYTFQLNGQTASGDTLTAAGALTITRSTVQLTVGALVQAGPAVTVSVAWPDGITPKSVDCGTTTPQTFTGSTGTCTYTKPGAYTITGRFINPEDGVTLTVAAPPVTVPALTPTSPTLALLIDNTPITDPTAVSVYHLPATLTAVVTLTRPDGIGVLDPLNTQTSVVSVTPDGVPAIVSKLTVGTDPLTATMTHDVKQIGHYTVAFTGKTLNGATLSAQADFTLSVTAVTLQAGPPVQDGNAVAVTVRWPDTGPTGTINCGFQSQIIKTQSGTCRYTKAGSYTIVGYFPDPAHGGLIPTTPVPVTIPLVVPTAVAMTITSVDDTAPTPTTTDPFPVYTIPQPSRYPVEVRVQLAFTIPQTLGILDPIDRSRSALTVALAGSTDTPQHVSIKQGLDAATFVVDLPLTVFRPNPDAPQEWRYRFTFAGTSLGGTSYTAQAELSGAIATGTTIAFDITRTDPPVPYAPAAYKYRVVGITTPTSHEPLAITWTLTDSQNTVLKTSATPTGYVAALPAPGTYTVTVTASGPLSGTATWTDTITVPELPAPDAAVIKALAPKFNRPPADYRFTAVPPKLPDPRERLTTPTWTIDGTPLVKGGTSVVTTFTTAGDHSVSVQIATSYNRTISGSTTVTVNPNVPPVVTIDCSRSAYSTTQKQYLIYCRSNASDPDGRIATLDWTIPELNYEKLNTTAINVGTPNPITVTVQLAVTDNSGATTTASTTLNLSALPTH